MYSAGVLRDASAMICPMSGGLRRAWQNFITASRTALFFVISAPIRMPHSL